jgi:hypothetical protein
MWLPLRPEGLRGQPEGEAGVSLLSDPWSIRRLVDDVVTKVPARRAPRNLGLCRGRPPRTSNAFKAWISLSRRPLTGPLTAPATTCSRTGHWSSPSGGCLRRKSCSGAYATSAGGHPRIGRTSRWRNSYGGRRKPKIDSTTSSTGAPRTSSGAAESPNAASDDYGLRAETRYSNSSFFEDRLRNARTLIESKPAAPSIPA